MLARMWIKLSNMLTTLNLNRETTSYIVSFI